MAYDWEKLKKRAEQIDNLFGGSKTVTTSEVKRLGKSPVSTSSDNFVSKSIEQKKSETKSFPTGDSGGILKMLTTPAESGYFEGASFLPSSPQAFARGLGYHAERAGAGILGGIEGITDFVGSSAAGIASDLTSLGGQFNNPVSDWLRNQSEDFLHTSPTLAWKDSINERYQPSVGDQRLGSVTENVAQMLLPMGAGKVVSAISAGSSALNAANAASKGAAASKALFGLQAAGQGAQEAAMEGASTGLALTYGTLSGLLETSIESLAGGIPGLGKGVLSDVADKVASNSLVTRALDIAGEGGEEALSTIITPYIQRAVYNADAENATADEIAESAIMGMVAAGILQGGIELPTAVSQVMDTRRSVGTNQDIVSRANQRLSSPGQVMSDFMASGLTLPTVPRTVQSAQATQDTASQSPVEASVGAAEDAAPAASAATQQTAQRKQGLNIPVQERTWQDAGNRKVNAFQYDHPELRPYYAEAARSLKYDLAGAVKGERTPTFDADGYITGYTGTTRSVTSPIAQALDNAGLSYAQIDKAIDDLIADNGQENYAAAKKLELVLDDMLTNGYTDSDGYNVPPNEEYLAARDLVNSGTEFRMSEEEWNSLMSQEPEGPAFLPTAEYGPESSVGAARYGFDPYTNLQGKYGTLPEGEKPSRVVDVPARTSDKSKVSLTARTVMEAAATPDSALPDIAQLVVDGRLSYMPVSNNQRTVMAESKIKSVGYSDALANWRTDVRAGKSSADLVAMGAQLYNATVNAGDTKAAMDILYDYTRLIRSGAQATQAARILKTLTPAGTLYMIQKEVDNINDAQSGKKKRNVTSTDNVPVEIWMQRVGENLADELSRRIEAPKNQTQTVAQTILSDLRRYANETVPKRLQSGKTRTEMDRIMDLFQNKTAYNEAWAAAKDTLSDTFENDPDALAAFDDWLNQSLDYTKALTKELTKQSNIVIPEDLADAFLKADTEEARARALNAIYQNVADQMPSTWLEKFNALRYTNMLGNFKTQGRNLSGNVVMKGVRAVKVKQAAAIEAIASKVSGGKIQRSTTFLRDKGLYKEALSDFENVKPFAMGAGKYSDSAISSPMSEINERRAIFKNSGVWGTLPTSSLAAKALRKATDIAWKVPESYRVATDWLMNNKYFGDEAFSRSAYADTLSRYLKANGITAEQMKSGNVDSSLLERAREKAISAAREATFRDNNQFAEAISSIGFRNPDTLSKKAINVGLQGTMPFLRTPANIFVTAERYSPLGIVNTAIQAARVVKGSDQVSWNDVIDSLSSTLTGTGIFILGMFLRDQGWLTGGSGDDDKQASFDNLTGKQEYALVLPDGQSFTLDWMSPVSMPLFMGVEWADAAAEGGISTEDSLNAAKSMSDVLLNMSMMQGINDQLSDISYSEYPLFDLALNSLLGYLQQGLTNSLAGQAERAFEPIRMTTYTDKNLPLPTDTQYLLGSTSAKTPGWDYQQIPYIDAWGRTESNGPLPLRMFNNFLNPAYTSQENVTALDEEIQRLYDDTGDNAVIPDRAPRYLTVGGERVDLTADQYVQYATERGQTAFELGSDLIENDIFSGLTNQQKVDALDKVYTYADAMAKANVSDYEPEDWMKEVDASGVDPVTAILYRMSEADTDTKRKMLMDDDSLTASEKAALEEIVTGKKATRDYSSDEAFALSGLSDSGQEKWPKAEAWGMPYEDYVKFYPICAASGKGTTKAVVIQNLIDAGMSQQDALNFWKLIRS